MTKYDINELLAISDRVEEFCAVAIDLLPQEVNPLDFADTKEKFWAAMAAGEFQAHVYDANEGDGNFSMEELIEIVKQSFK